MNTAHKVEEFLKNGYSVFNDIIAEKDLKVLRLSLEKSSKEYDNLRKNSGVVNSSDGTLHHPILFSKDFLKLLDCDKMHVFLNKIFRGNYTLNTYGAVINRPNLETYVHSIHRDTRFFAGEYTLFTNVLFAVDDFTHENGATAFLFGSQNSNLMPDEKTFNRDSDRLCLKAGEMCVFNSNIWHRAMINKSVMTRRAITMTFARPWIKPQFDFTKSFSKERDKFSDNVRQSLGFNSRTPSTIEEWLLPASKRFYLGSQDDTY